MNGLNKFLAATFLSTAMLFTSAAQAMEIRQFDKMADEDQARYIGDLIVGAEKVLTDEGKPDLAAKVKHLFTTKNAGDEDVIGMVEFENNLALLRVEDAKNAEKNPKDPRIEVEDVVAITLEKKCSEGFQTAVPIADKGRKEERRQKEELTRRSARQSTPGS